MAMKMLIIRMAPYDVKLASVLDPGSDSILKETCFVGLDLKVERNLGGILMIQHMLVKGSSMGKF